MGKIDYSRFDNEIAPVNEARKEESIPVFEGPVMPAQPHGHGSVGNLGLIACPPLAAAVEITDRVCGLISTIAVCIEMVEIEKEHTRQIREIEETKREEARQQTKRIRMQEREKTKRVALECRVKAVEYKKDLLALREKNRNAEVLSEQDHAVVIREIDGMQEIIRTLTSANDMLIKEISDIGELGGNAERHLESLDKNSEQLAKIAGELAGLRRG